jgi:hypothetical protein
LQAIEGPNTSYLLFMLPAANFTNQYSILQLHVLAPGIDTFSVDAELNCQWYQQPSQSVIAIQLYGRAGLNRLFSTGLFSYDSILSQVHITGDIRLIRSVEIRHIVGNPDFAREIFVIRSVCSGVSFLCLLLYCVSLVMFLRFGIRVEQILSAASLFLAVVANIPINLTNQHYRNVLAVCFNSFFRGLFRSFNTVGLFLFVFRMNGGDVMGFAFLMSLLFIVGNAIQIVTNDTRILNLLFDGNMDVWMFFVSVSLMGRAALFALQIYHAFFSRGGRTPLSTVHCGLILLEVTTAVCQGTVYYANTYGNFALDFFGDYILQTFFAFAFADMHWPQVPPVRKMSLVEQHMVTEDLRFPPAGDMDGGLVPDPFCL